MRIAGSGVSSSKSMSITVPGGSTKRVLETYSGNSTGSANVSVSQYRESQSPGRRLHYRRQTNCSGLVTRNPNVVAPRQRRDDADACASTDHAVVSRPLGDGQIEPRVVEYERHPGFVRKWKTTT